MSDQYKGQGGAYVRDANTGKRKLAERTVEATPTLAAEPVAQDATQAQTEQPDTNSQE